MSALTVRLSACPPVRPQTKRLRALAESRGATLNRLIDELATVMLTEFNAETRFRLRAERGVGQVACGLSLLDKAEGQREAAVPKPKKAMRQESSCCQLRRFTTGACQRISEEHTQSLLDKVAQVPNRTKHDIGIAVPARRAHPCRRSPSATPMPTTM